jgi:mono/diheme cytochrome c family protein
MKITTAILLCLTLFFSCYGIAGSRPEAAPSASTVSVHDQETMRVEGERRFYSNCGRCHAAPHKFPPRMMATIVRHMRVRATLTDDDMKFILFYMTQ